MMEITRIVTIKITTIGQAEEEPKPFAVKGFESGLKELLDVDDVNVVKVQDFIMDKEECNG